MKKEIQDLIKRHTSMIGVPFKTLLKRALVIEDLILEECNESLDLLENLYLIKLDLKEIPKCPNCSKNLKFINYSKGYNKTCSKKCGSLLGAKTLKENMIEKYGVKNPSQLVEVKEKKKESYIKSLGVDNPSKSKEIRDKKKQNCLDNFGVENWNQLDEVKEKIRKTNLRKFGESSPMKVKEINEKAKNTFIERYGKNARKKGGKIRLKTEKTNIEKYGFHSPTLNLEVRQKVKNSYLKNYDKTKKRGYLYKDYTFPSGIIVKVQGFENLFLNDYFKKGGLEENIIVNLKEIISKIGLIKYEKDGIIHNYYPDFYLINENKIIEVKSNYTFEKQKEKNLLKQQAVLEKNIDFEFVIYNSKKERIKNI